MNFANIEILDNNPICIMASAAEAWNSVPLVSLHQPIMGAMQNIDFFAVTTAIAILILTVNHSLNHEKAAAGNSAQFEFRKSVSGFWNTQTLERVHQKWRQQSARSVVVENEKYYWNFSNKLTNRQPAAWTGLSDIQGKTTTVWLSVLFLLLQSRNCFGQVPLSSAITGQAGFTQGSSIALLCSITYQGVKRQGTRFVRLFLPSGPSWPMAPLFIQLESISYGFRRISQGTRLYCNQFAGHLLLHLFTSLCLVPIFTLPLQLGAPIAAVVICILMALSAQETIVVVLQSGVFVLLASYYLTEVQSRKDPLAFPAGN